jgi:hypothetical protein
MKRTGSEYSPIILPRYIGVAESDWDQHDPNPIARCRHRAATPLREDVTIDHGGLAAHCADLQARDPQRR